MSKEEKIQIMNASVKPIINMLQSRLSNRVEALKAFEPNAMESLPDEVKKMREIEASRVRAVMQEQNDLVEILKIMYPDA